MKKKKFKLSIKKETVSNLNGNDMNQINGGVQTKLINTCGCTENEETCNWCTNYGDTCRFTFGNNSCPHTICN